MSLQGLGRRLRMTISGALFLSFLIASIAPANAAALLAAHDVIHAMETAQHVAAASPEISPSGHHHTGMPCNNQDAAHGLPCCSTGGCSMVFGWIAAPANFAPFILPAVQTYLNKALMPPDGLQFPPTLRPPRHFV